MFKSQGVRDVLSDGTASWGALGAVGMQLVSVPGTLAAYPITVILDGNEGAPVVVHNASWATQETSFQSLKVVGGVPGSQWELRTKVELDAIGLQLPTARDGVLLTRTAPPVVLFDLDSARSPEDFSSNIVNAGYGNIFIAYSPQVKRALPVPHLLNDPDAAFTGYAWDTSGYSRVLFVVESFTAPFAMRPNTIIVPKVDLCGHAGMSTPGGGFGNVLPALRTVQAGTVGNLGDAGTSVPGSEVAGQGRMDRAWVLLGAPVNRVTDNTTEDTALMPATKFRIVTNNGLDNSVSFTDGSYRLRIYALAW